MGKLTDKELETRVKEFAKAMDEQGYVCSIVVNTATPETIKEGETQQAAMTICNSSLDPIVTHITGLETVTRSIKKQAVDDALKSGEMPELNAIAEILKAIKK